MYAEIWLRNGILCDIEFRFLTRQMVFGYELAVVYEFVHQCCHCM